MEETQNLQSLAEASNKDCEGSRKKMRLLGKKLSLKSEGSEENATTRKQDEVADHSRSTAIPTVPSTCLADVSVKQNATSRSMSVSADSGVTSKKGYQANRTNLQLHEQRLPVTSESPNQRSSGSVEDKFSYDRSVSASDTNDYVTQSSDDVLVESMAKSVGGSSDSVRKPSEGNGANVRSLGQKMPLKLAKLGSKSNGQKDNMAPDHLPSLSGFSNLQRRSSDVSRENSVGCTNLIQQNSRTEHVLPSTDSVPNKECNQGRKKPSLLSKRLSLKSEPSEMDMSSDKGYKQPDRSHDNRKPSELPLSAPVPISQSQTRGQGFVDSQKSVSQRYCPFKQNATYMKNDVVLDSDDSTDECQIIEPGAAHSQKNARQSNCSIKEKATLKENVVSDSEDSADECEKKPSRSRLSLMKRRLAGKLRL
jgi:ubiquitin-conjugating enzyme E2 T